MKKYYKILYSLSLILLILFIIVLCIDYANYDPIITSAPFYTYILIRAIEFLIPCIFIFIIGLILKKK